MSRGPVAAVRLLALLVSPGPDGARLAAGGHPVPGRREGAALLRVLRRAERRGEARFGPARSGGGTARHRRRGGWCAAAAESSARRGLAALPPAAACGWERVIALWEADKSHRRLLSERG